MRETCDAPSRFQIGASCAIEISGRFGDQARHRLGVVRSGV
jgi:hypothetical protein